MIRVLMFDLGMTLLDANDRPFPHVTDALSALASRPVKSCLISDFDMTPPRAGPVLSVDDAITLQLDFRATRSGGGAE